MANLIQKSLLLKKMCELCIHREKKLPTCKTRRYSCNDYKCAEQPWKPRQTYVKPEPSKNGPD